MVKVEVYRGYEIWGESGMYYAYDENGRRISGRFTREGARRVVDVYIKNKLR